MVPKYFPKYFSLCHLQKLFFHVLPLTIFLFWSLARLQVLYMFSHSLSSSWPRNLSGCAGMLLGHNWWNREGVKTGDWEALKQNTIVIVLILISIVTLMQFFSLCSGIPILWSLTRLSLETRLAQGLRGCLYGFELVEGLLQNGWEAEKKN